MARKIKMSRPGFDLRNMCTPATIYFIISMIGLILIGINNLDNNDNLCVGNYCYVGNSIFVINALYVLFWTFILDLMCKSGYSSLSWFVLLLPFIIFIIFSTFIKRYKEGECNPGSRSSRGGCPDVLIT